MRTFTEQAAQGDILIRRVKDLPANAVEQPPENGQHIVTHSETGHHHVMRAQHVRMFRLPDDGMPGMMSYLKVDEVTELKHLRPHDTHESLEFKPGIYEIRRQREYTPEGWRRVAD